MAITPRRILILQGHPDPRGGHFGHALAAAYAAGAVEAGYEARVIAIATLGFPLLQSRDDLDHGVVPDAIRGVQAAMLEADHIVLFHPVWNGGMPALVRGFFEQTFRTAFIFPDAKRDARLGFFSSLAQRKALQGKTARVVATMQMPAFVYRWYFHPHPEKNTLRLSGIRSVKESLIGHVESADGRGRTRWLGKMRGLGSKGR